MIHNNRLSLIDGIFIWPERKKKGEKAGSCPLTIGGTQKEVRPNFNTGIKYISLHASGRLVLKTTTFVKLLGALLGKVERVADSRKLLRLSE